MHLPIKCKERYTLKLASKDNAYTRGEEMVVNKLSSFSYRKGNNEIGTSETSQQNCSNFPTQCTCTMQGHQWTYLLSNLQYTHTHTHTMINNISLYVHTHTHKKPRMEMNTYFAMNRSDHRHGNKKQVITRIESMPKCRNNKSIIKVPRSPHSIYIYRKI